MSLRHVPSILLVSKNRCPRYGICLQRLLDCLSVKTFRRQMATVENYTYSELKKKQFWSRKLYAVFSGSINFPWAVQIQIVQTWVVQFFSSLDSLKLIPAICLKCMKQWWFYVNVLKFLYQSWFQKIRFLISTNYLSAPEMFATF